MKRALLPALIACAVSVAQGEAAAESWLPEAPTAEAVQQLPAAERTAAAAAIKRVMLRHTIRLKEERHRYTRENAAECVALAEQLRAPEPFIRLLKVAAAEQLSGRDLYDYQQTLSRLLRAYMVDALAIRLFVEGVRFPAEELRRVADALPVESVFNLLPAQGVVSDEDAELHLTTLADMGVQIAELYKGITNREQADKVAQELLRFLPVYDLTAPTRMALASQKSSRLHGLYQRIVEPVGQVLTEPRRRLHEANYFGSALLASLDYLMN